MNTNLAVRIAAASCAVLLLSCSSGNVAAGTDDGSADGKADRTMSQGDTGPGGEASGESGPTDGGHGGDGGGGDTGNHCGETLCGAACVDLQTDDSNCGGCGLECSTGCTNGECVVTVTATAPGLSPWALAIDSANLYWTSQGKCPADGGAPTGVVMSVPIAGGAAATLAMAQPAPDAIAVQGTSLYWLNKGCVGLGEVVTSALDGSAVTTLVNNQKSPNNIAVDAKNVYWTTADAVLSIPVGGGIPTTLASSQGASAGIAVEAGEVFWAQTAKPFDVNRISTTGASLKKLATGCTGAVCSGVAGMNADGKNVYWSALPSGSYMSYYVFEAPLGGGTVTTLASMQGIAADFASDGKTLYFTNYGLFNSIGDSVVKVGTGGGTATTLASKQPNPRGIAVDDRSVYWANSGSPGAIMKATPK